MCIHLVLVASYHIYDLRSSWKRLWNRSSHTLRQCQFYFIRLKNKRNTKAESLELCIHNKLIYTLKKTQTSDFKRVKDLSIFKAFSYIKWIPSLKFILFVTFIQHLFHFSSTEYMSWVALHMLITCRERFRSASNPWPKVNKTGEATRTKWTHDISVGRARSRHYLYTIPQCFQPWPKVNKTGKLRGPSERTFEAPRPSAWISAYIIFHFPI